MPTDRESGCGDRHGRQASHPDEFRAAADELDTADCWTPPRERFLDEIEADQAATTDGGHPSRTGSWYACVCGAAYRNRGAALRCCSDRPLAEVRADVR